MDSIRPRSSRFSARLRSIFFISILAIVATNVSATRVENNPPYPPAFPEPSDGATGVSLNRYLSWQTYEPDGDYEGLTYDIYLGNNPDPPLIKAGHEWCCGSAGALNNPGPFPSNTVIYWRVVAKDSQGGEASSPVWSFTTGPNHAPLAPFNPHPPDNAPKYSSNNDILHWETGDADYHVPVHDIYFGTTAPPPLVATNVVSPGYGFGTATTIGEYQAGPFSIGMTYYWRVVTRDLEGAEISGPTWTFTVGENEPPVFGGETSPAEGATADVAPAYMSWSVSDPNVDYLSYDVYLGTTNPPSLAAEDLESALYWHEPFLTGTTYYWYVVADDGMTQTTSPTHSFVTVPPGDVNRDGQITVADATCTLNLTVLALACTNNYAESRGRTDVNCDNELTPADARCIHKSVVDGSCTICSGGTAPASTARASTPLLEPLNTWFDWDTLKVQLSVSNLPSLKSFGLSVETKPYLNMVRVLRRGATNSFEPLNSSGAIGVGSFPYQTYKILLVGYTLGDIDCTSQTEFLELHFLMDHEDRNFDYVKLYEFVDDLAGVPDVVIAGAGVPVLFSSFTAVARGGGVDLAWELQSDEAMESYTVFRREGSGPSTAIADGAVEGTSGSYHDTSARAGKKYHYELVIRTSDGDDFRSPMATVSMPALALTLHQNVPNPFNPQTAIRYDLPTSSRVRLTIFDAAGRRVRTLVDEDQAPGSRESIWTGRDDGGNPVSSGVYFYVLDAGKHRLTRKLVLLK